MAEASASELLGPSRRHRIVGIALLTVGLALLALSVIAVLAGRG